MAADSNLLYLGTSNGKVVSVPIRALKKDLTLNETMDDQDDWKDAEDTMESKDDSSSSSRGLETSPPNPRGLEKSPKRSRGVLREKESKELKENRRSNREDKERVLREWQEVGSRCLPHSAVALHSHMDERVRDLLFLQLPELKLSKLNQAAEMVQYHSLPNLASPFGGRVPVSPPVLSFRSLLLSVGRGHVEYVKEREEEVVDGDGSRKAMQLHRERHEAFQLLVWAHK